MADDTLQSGTDTIATDHVSTLNGAAITPGATTPKVQRVKVTFGDDGTARDASTAFPLPTVQTGALPTGANTIGAVTVSGTADVADRAARLLGVLSAGANEVGAVKELRAATLAVTATGAAAAAVTLTLPAPGAGLFHYIASIEITLYSSAARTGAAAANVVTSTNIPGTPAWTFSTAGAIGTTERQTTTPATPLRSTAANTATTVAAPVATGGIWRLTATYFTAA